MCIIHVASRVCEVRPSRHASHASHSFTCSAPDRLLLQALVIHLPAYTLQETMSP